MFGKKGVENKPAALIPLRKFCLKRILAAIANEKLASCLGGQPEHGANTDTEIARNAPDANPLFSSPPNRRHLLCVCVLQAPAAKLGALIAGASDPGEHALADHGPFELGRDAHHLEHRPAGWRRGVQALLMQDPGLMRGARAEEIACKEGRGPHPATKDNATDFVGVEDDPLQ
jgi:hypothetical protein